MYFEFRIDCLEYGKSPITRYKCISDVYDAKRNINIIRQYKAYINEHQQDYSVKYYFYIVLLDDNFRFIKTIK